MGRDRRRSSLTSGRSDGGGGKGEVEGVKDMVAKKGWTRIHTCKCSKNNTQPTNRLDRQSLSLVVMMGYGELFLQRDSERSEPVTSR